MSKEVLISKANDVFVAMQGWKKPSFLRRSF